MEDLLQNTTFWTAVSFVLFIVLVVWKGRQKVAETVNARIARVRDDIEQAERLKDEANKELADMKRKQREASEQAEQIVENAKTEAKTMKREADKRFKEQMARREQQALDKISQAEAAAVREVQGRAVDLALAAASAVIAERMSGEPGKAAMDKAISDVSAKLH